MRPPNIIRPIRLNTSIPEDLRAKMELHLYSEVEGKVPFGAMQRFILEQIREYFNPQKSIPIANSRIVKLLLLTALEDLPQEWWVDNFQNPEDAFSWATQFTKDL